MYDLIGLLLRDNGMVIQQWKLPQTALKFTERNVYCETYY